MLAVQKWTIGKSFLFAFVAPQLDTTARDIHLSFQQTKERRVLSHQFPLPHLPSWFALYRSHREPLKFLREESRGQACNRAIRRVGFCEGLFEVSNWVFIA
jgi:hypothetical protein